MQYINPFDLLEITTNNLSDVDANTIKRAKRKLLSEIELSDSKSYQYNVVSLSKSDCIKAIDDLDNKDKREFHFFIFKNPDLNSFLTKGDLLFFKTYKIESIYKLSEFLDFISPFFTLQYDKALSLNYKQQNIENVKLLLSIKPITNDVHQELCFQGTYSTIKEIESEILAINNDVTNDTSLFVNFKIDELATKISKKVDIELLNSLPNYFQSLRNSIAQTIRNLARDINNDPYNKYKSAYEIIEIANNISTDGLIKQTISKGYYTIKNNYESNLPKQTPSISNQATTVSKSTVDDSKETTIQEKEPKNSTTSRSLLVLICGVLTWALFNKLIQTFILSISLLYFITSIYKIYKKAELYKNSKIGDVLIFIITFVACVLGFSSMPFAIFFISYNLIIWVHGLFSDLVPFRVYKNGNSIANLLLTVLLTFLITSYQESTNNSNANITADNTESIKNDNSVPSNNSYEPAINNQKTDTIPTPPKPIYSYPNITNGNIIGCSNIKQKYNKNLDTKLIISCGNNTDVAVKMIDYATEKSIRFVFINKNSTYIIRNIPEGQYYLKIAYGSDWGVKEGESICEGRFTTNAFYKKGDEVLDYYLIYSSDGYRVPSFTLKLNAVITEDKMGTFNTNNINETEFYNE